MRLSISILCFNNLSTTKDCLNRLIDFTELDDVQVILTDNHSTDGTLDYLNKVDIPNKIVIHHHENYGFGRGHNEALKVATGEYFLVLNNDMMIKDLSWKDKALKAILPNDVALVGLEKTPCSLKNDGQGYFNPRLRDYVEGSFMLGKTALFNKYGLFSPTIKMFVFEDSDVSLRYRQMGYKIYFINFEYQHLHAVTQRLINPRERHIIVSGNQKVFIKRWQTYLSKRSFSNKIYVEIPTIGIGDILRMTPVLEGLRQDHPTAEILVVTKHPQALKNIPFASQVVESLNGHRGPFDRVITLNPNFGDVVPIVEACAKSCSTTISHYPKPVIKLTNDEIIKAYDILQGKQDPILFLTKSSHRNWQGRDWPYLEDLINRIKEGFPDELLVTVGKDIDAPKNADIDLVNKTTLRELFALVSISKLVVCSDNLLLHVSQAFTKPCVCLFGATDPQYMYVPSDSVKPVIAHGVYCAGCYQQKKKPTFNRCQRRDEVCMSAITVDQVIKEMRRFL